MALQRKDRGPRITVACVRCGGPARLTNVETVMFSNGVQQAIYECDCGGTVKRVLPSESGQASRQTGPYANHKIRAATPRTLRMTENDNRLLRRNSASR